MIGKYARGFRHLKRVVGSSKTKRIFILQNGRILDSTAIVCPIDGSKEHLVLFQNMGGNNDTFNFPIEYRTIADNLLSKYNRYYIAKDSRMLFQLGRKYFILDDIFEEEYEKFQNSNKKLLDQVFGKYCYANDSVPKFIFALIGNSPNLFVWAVTNYFKNNVTLCTIEHIINWSKKYNQLVGKLSKGTITAYNGRDKVMQLMSEIVKLRSVKRANDSVNLFNTTQKKLLKKIDMNDKNVHILNRFGRLSNPKKHNFVRKMSTIEDVNDIMHQMSLLSNIHFEWNRDSLMDYIQNSENINCDIIYDDKNIVLVKVNTYDTVKLLAKTTNWCISKNKRYWNDYVEHRHESSQFVMFDFNKPEDHELSIVGFTSAKNNGITNAHSFSNNNLMTNYTIGNKLKSFFTKEVSNNIFSIISVNKIPLDKVFNLNPLKYEWNMNSFLSFLPFCINEEEYTIHKIDEELGRVAFFTKHENVKFIINHSINEFLYHPTFQGVFVFMDFSEEEGSPEKIRYAYVFFDDKTKEEISNDVYDSYGRRTNISFDMMLEEFDLPYDIICRVDDDVKRFECAFRNYDINILNKIISNRKVVNDVLKTKNKFFQQTSGSIIYETIFNMQSLEYIELIIDNNYLLSDFVSKTYLNDILSTLIYDINGNYRILGRLPIKQDYDEYVYNHHNHRLGNLLFYFKVLSKIVESENNKGFKKQLEQIIYNTKPNSEFGRYLLDKVIDVLDFNRYNDSNKYFLRLIASFKDETYNKIILDNNIEPNLGNYYLSIITHDAPYYEELMKKYHKENDINGNEDLFMSFIEKIKNSEYLKYSMTNTSSN